jgi:hypothetical protein
MLSMSSLAFAEHAMFCEPGEIDLHHCESCGQGELAEPGILQFISAEPKDNNFEPEPNIEPKQEPGDAIIK